VHPATDLSDQFSLATIDTKANFVPLCRQISAESDNHPPQVTLATRGFVIKTTENAQ
jgi:hypothetical protein